MRMDDYSYEDIIISLKNAGLKKGDKIFVHSNLGYFGKLKDAKESIEYGINFKNAIFNVIGEEGTLIVPTFSYSFMNHQIFDINETPSVCGIFSEIIRKNIDSVRTEDPNFSISVLGRDIELFTTNLSNHSFGKNSFWEKFLKSNGKFCNFNFDSGTTFFHYIEKMLNVPYRYDKEFSGLIKKDNKLVEETWTHFVFDHEKSNHWPNFEKFSKKASDLGFVKCSNLGKGQITCIFAKDMADLIKLELEKNPSFLIEGSV